jgi:hypothetical protein
MTLILATQEDRGSKKIVFKILSQKIPPQKNRAGGVTQGEDPEFNPSTAK